MVEKKISKKQIEIYIDESLGILLHNLATFKYALQALRVKAENRLSMMQCQWGRGEGGPGKEFRTLWCFIVQVFREFSLRRK